MVSIAKQNPYRIKVKQWREENGVETQEELLAACEEFMSEASGPAMCSEGCEGIEPDGTCEHGAPSLLLALGLI